MSEIITTPKEFTAKVTVKELIVKEGNVAAKPSAVITVIQPAATEVSADYSIVVENPDGTPFIGGTVVVVPTDDAVLTALTSAQVVTLPTADLTKMQSVMLYSADPIEGAIDIPLAADAVRYLTVLFNGCVIASAKVVYIETA